MRKINAEKGISMVVVLWVVTILTVVVAATALMTYSDISSAINIRKRGPTLRAADACADFVISYLPRHKKLHELDSLFSEKNTHRRIFYENSNLDTVFAFPLFLSRDSSIIGCLALPAFIKFNRDSSLIVSRPTTTDSGETASSDTMVNPTFSQDGAVIRYRTRGVIEQGKDMVAYRRFAHASAFSLPAGGEQGGVGFGHTMY